MGKLMGLGHLFVMTLLSAFAQFIVVPSMTDVTMAALCPGKDECSLAIYLSGFQQAVVGVGSVVMAPLMGNLSDKYGRKAVLTLPMAVSIIPLAILAFNRTTKFFYAHYVLKTLIGMAGEGGSACIVLAYVADNVPEQKRAAAFGVLSGVASGAFVFGTLAARFLPIASTFQIATIASMASVVYMRIFLKESAKTVDGSTQPLLRSEPIVVTQDNCEATKPRQTVKNIPSIGDLIHLLKHCVTYRQAVVVSFFNTLADSGLQASMLYFLKARFHFNKIQFADLMLMAGLSGTASQLLLMPLLLPAIREERLLSMALLVGCTSTVLNSVAWAAWVPYAITAFSIVTTLGGPCIRSIASKQFGPSEQGMAQGCISGMSSLANIVAPFIFSPLTALFLSEAPPFKFPGFSILCIGLALMLAFIQSIMIRPAPATPGNGSSSEACTEP